MIHDFKIGDIVHVWPRPGLLVQEHPGIPGRFLASTGSELPWSAWVHDRVLDGSMLLTDPNAPQHAPELALQTHTETPTDGGE
jgi:hypothetical protein